MKILKNRWVVPTGAVLLLAFAGMLFTLFAGDNPGPSLDQMENDDRTALTEALLTNRYRAFDFRAEEEIYDALAVSADGEILLKIYLDMKKALEIRELGGARVKVTDVTVDSSVPRKDRDGEWLTTEWTVSGTVGHWGHVHTRNNHYIGNIRIAFREGVWKISDFQILEEERVF